jgi:Protein of unknown function (DUF429)
MLKTPATVPPHMLPAANEREPATWLGIDFSGDHRMWTPGRSTSNVWVATLEEREGVLALADVRRVRELAGVGAPFERLTELLGKGAYSAAGIDAPFSVPESRCPKGGHAALLAEVSSWECDGRPFATARTLLRHLLPEVNLPGVKEYRAAEKGWGINVRSTTWAGARGGAAMTVACLTLLARARRPIWPFAGASTPGLLAEAFPAAQLKTWRLPFYGYNGAAQAPRDERQRILEGLRARVETNGYDGVLLGSADALDAVLCAFAAIAVKRNALVRQLLGPVCSEGWIAVYR